MNTSGSRALKTSWSCVLAICLAAAPFLRADRPEPGNTPDPRTRVFPHIDWAKNCEGGVPKVLFVVNGQSSWEIYELAMRMELDYDVFYTNGGRAHLFAPETDYYHEGIRLFPEAVAELRGLLKKDWEAIVFLECPPYILPPELEFRVLEKVVAGAGVVCLNASRWGTAFRYPGVKAENVTDLFDSVPKAGLTLPVYKQDGNPQLSQIGKLLPPSYRSVTEPYELKPVVVRTVGKGRIYEFNPGGGNYFGGPVIHPASRQEPEEYLQNEYFYALGAKLLLTAAGRGPQTRLTLDLDGKTLEPGKALTFTAKLSGPFSGRARVAVRTHRGAVVHEETAAVKMDAAGGVPLAVPALLAGQYYVDVWLDRKGKTVDWASGYVTVRSGKVRIRSFELAGTSFTPGGTARAVTHLDGATPGTTLSARILDAEDRILVEQVGIKPQQGRAEVSLSLDRTREQYHILEVDVLEGGVRADTARHWFCVTRPWDPDLFVFTDDGGRNLYGARRRAIFREYGISTAEVGSDATQLDPRPVLASGLRLSTRIWTTHCNQYTGGCISNATYPDALSHNFETVARYLKPFGLTFFSVGDDSGTGADFCGSYPNWVRSYIRKLSEKYKGDFRAFGADHSPKGTRPKWGAWRYMSWQGNLKDILELKPLPDELKLMRACWKENYGTVAAFNRASATAFKSFDEVQLEDLTKIQYVNPCLLGFRDEMKAKYGTAGKLNAAWGTQLKSFEEITSKVIEELAPQGKLCAKLDKTWYLEDLFIRNMAAAARGVRRVAPDIGIGMGAASLPNIIPDVLQHIDSIMPYKGERDLELIRSLPHRYCGQTIGVYGGKKVPATARENQAWETVFSGGNFIWFWSMCTGGLMGDLSTNPGRSGVMLENIREMQSGIARALIRGKRLHDGIGILHARRAGGLSKLVKTLGAVFSSQVGFQHIVEDLGMQYRYTSTKEVEDGVLKTGEFRVLILPYTQVLSETEIEGIRSFVQAGGTLIADLRPTTHDWTGRPLAKGALDDLFGVSQNCAEAVPVKGTMAWTRALDDDPVQPSAEVPGMRGDASVKADGATALAASGETPMVLVNAAGKGHAVLLNHAPTTYDILLNRGKAGHLTSLYRALFGLGGAKARFRVVGNDGREVSGAEIAVFKNGPIEYLTLEKKSYQFEQYPIEAEIQLGREYEVYNTRTGKKIGQTDRIPIRLTGLGCYVYTLLPYRVSQFAVEVPRRVKRGAEVSVAMELTVRGAEPGPHTVRVDVYRPDGKRLWPMYKLETVNGAAVVKLPVAANEEPGNWSIVATDVTTGLSVKKTMKVVK